MSIDSGPAGVIFKNDFSVINWIATVSANIGGAHTPLLGGPKVIDTNHMAHSEFGDLAGAGGVPAVAKERHWSKGSPQYNYGHGKRAIFLKQAHTRSICLPSSTTLLPNPPYPDTRAWDKLSLSLRQVS